MTRLNRNTLAIIAIIIGLFGPVMVWAADQADAATITFTFDGSDFLIPRPAERAPVGELRLVATYDVVANGYAEYIGSVCTFVVTAANGVSVHQNNQGYLVTNGSSTDVLRTEDEANVLRTVLDDPTLRLGATVQLYNIIGEWAEGDNIREGFVGTSVEYEVTATCTIEDDTTTTSTTVPEVTSTTAPTSTTTTTTPNSSSTTVPPASTTTTTPSGSSTTSVPASTTTTQPPNTSTTAPNGSTSTTVPAESTTSSIIKQDTTTTIGTGSTLPHTGFGSVGLALAGAALLLLGGAVLVAGRES